MFVSKENVKSSSGIKEELTSLKFTYKQGNIIKIRVFVFRKGFIIGFPNIRVSL